MRVCKKHTIICINLYNMINKLIVVLVFIFCMVTVAECPTTDFYCVLARVTTYSIYERGEKKVNHRGKKLTNNNGVAVPSNTLRDGTQIFIEGVGMRVVDDRLPKRSVRKHERIAKKIGINLDICVDLRYNNLTRKQLRKKDLGYKEIRVYEKGWGIVKVYR